MLLDVIAGYYLPGLFGWCFLVFVLLVESLLMSKYLHGYWYNSKVYVSVIVSNIVTTIVGWLVVREETGHLLTWIPLESYRGDIRLERTVLSFLAAFVATMMIESLINLIFLGRSFAKGKVLLGTLWVNLLTYIVAAGVIFVFALMQLRVYAR